MTGVWASFLLVLAGGTTLAWLVVRVHEGGVRPVRGLVAFFGRQSKTGRVLLGTFFVALWMIAGTKPDGGSEESRPYTSLQTRVGDADGTNSVQMAAGPDGGHRSPGSPEAATDALHAESQNGLHSTADGDAAGTETADDGRTDATPITSTNTVQADATPAASANANAARALTAEDFARGFVMHRVGTGEAFDFAAPANATVCADWEAFGVAEDWFYLSFTNWAFRVGTNEMNRFRVFSFGRVDLHANHPYTSLQTRVGPVEDSSASLEGRDVPVAPQTTAWTEEHRFTDYAAGGGCIEYVVTESSDCGTVTNSVTAYDLLGRVVTTAVPGRTAQCSSPPTPTTARRRRSSRRRAMRPDSRRTRQTGLSDVCRRHVVTVTGAVCVPSAEDGISETAGVRAESLVSFDPSIGVETETVTSSAGPTTVRRSRHGLVLADAAAGTATDSAYDAFGNRTSATDALGNTICRAYDAFGNVTAVRGATYPVEMDYDSQSRRVALRTTRDGTAWDETRWTYDAATGVCTSKTYADGSTVAYTYTPDNLPLRTTYAGGRWKENVYDARRQVVGVVSGDGAQDIVYVRDAYGRVVSESNAVASAVYALAVSGTATNEAWTVGGDALEIVRSLDPQDRPDGLAVPSSGYSLRHAYADDGHVESISSALAVVEYAYTPDRPVTRNADAFGYNARGEVVFATVGGNVEAHEYDGIGNSTIAAFNGVTNACTANGLNQYASIVCASASPCETAVEYDLDGNMTQCGDWTFTYDAANRLKTVSSNGVLLVTNFYDAKGRRVRKVTPESTMTFFYDGWNLIEERVANANGTASTIHHYWGKDISGTLQGAGGVGGLLYLTVDGSIYIPFYDNNGNAMRYLDASGSTVAQYTYNAFGCTISQTGPLAHVFRHRFSTKYFDAATGLYYYGHCFYSPVLRRWLTCDPIEERGGLNLYGFCGNNAVLDMTRTDGRTLHSRQPMKVCLTQ